jgi:mannose-6-phosphate isomerase-like protein (cupin superfamily)
MQLQEIEVIKSDSRGSIYNCGNSNFIARKEWTVSADHTHNDPETVYIVKGDVELTIGNETQVVHAPIMYRVGPNVYHKLIALSDIELVIDREEK